MQLESTNNGLIVRAQSGKIIVRKKGGTFFFNLGFNKPQIYYTERDLQERKSVANIMAKLRAKGWEQAADLVGLPTDLDRGEEVSTPLPNITVWHYGSNVSKVIINGDTYLAGRRQRIDAKPAVFTDAMTLRPITEKNGRFTIDKITYCPDHPHLLLMFVDSMKRQVNVTKEGSFTNIKVPDSMGWNS